MRLGIAADHGGFELKTRLVDALAAAGHDIVDFGADRFVPEDDYPDYVIPMAKAVAQKRVSRGIAICGSGVGACVAVNKIQGARGALITDIFSAHQGVEDDDMNIMCLGGRVTGFSLTWDLVTAFITARFKNEDRFIRRLNKLAAFENERSDCDEG